MKNNLLTYIALCSLALMVAGGLWAQNPKPDLAAKAPHAWQHLAMEHEGKSVTGSPDLARKINSLGDEGWQLVDVEAVTEAGTTTKIIFFFKRPK
jgi:hypothetical protein